MDGDHIEDSQAMRLVQYMPSAYQLLPSEKYIHDVTSDQGYYKIGDTFINFSSDPSIDSKIEGVTGGDPSLWANAQSFHEDLDGEEETYLPKKSYMILGCKIPTIHVIERQAENILIFHDGDGDGTNIVDIGAVECNDTDHDKVCDIAETYVYNTDPNNTDSDGDGYYDYEDD